MEYVIKHDPDTDCYSLWIGWHEPDPDRQSMTAEQAFNEARELSCDGFIVTFDAHAVPHV